tara:strand:+ start:17 stop:181 length:165 start_codon:yes stop_codon:yes gene_type:complete
MSKELEDIIISFKKLEELQKKVDYYKDLIEAISPNLFDVFVKENLLNQNKEDEV